MYVSVCVCGGEYIDSRDNKNIFLLVLFFFTIDILFYVIHLFYFWICIILYMLIVERGQDKHLEML